MTQPVSNPTAGPEPTPTGESATEHITVLSVFQPITPQLPPPTPPSTPADDECALAAIPNFSEGVDKLVGALKDVYTALLYAVFQALSFSPDEESNRFNRETSSVQNDEGLTFSQQDFLQLLDLVQLNLDEEELLHSLRQYLYSKSVDSVTEITSFGYELLQFLATIEQSKLIDGSVCKLVRQLLAKQEK